MYDSKRDKNKKILPEEYLNMIRPYLSDMIKDHKTQGIRWLQKSKWMENSVNNVN